MPSLSGATMDESMASEQVTLMSSLCMLVCRACIVRETERPVARRRVQGVQNGPRVVGLLMAAAHAMPVDGVGIARSTVH